MAHLEIEVTDRDGWRKSFSLNKAIAHIGTDPGNDLVLEAQHGGGVGARHAQLIWIPGQGCRLVNLSGQPIPLSGDQALEPHASMPLSNNSRITLGDFELAFQFESEVTSSSIGLSLDLPLTDLVPERPIEGGVVVRNLGEQTGVQFKLDVQGLDPACYEIGASPILFPGASKTVPLRIEHTQQPNPPAATYRLKIEASASAAYPGEVATVSQTLNVLPYYHHTVRVTRVK